MATLAVDVQAYTATVYDVGLYRPWTPALITTQLWLDATQNLTLVVDAVTTWGDRSGNGINPTQATPANKPNRVAAALNGLQVLNFDGTNDTLAHTSATKLLKNVSQALIVAVYKCDIVPVAARSALYISTATAGTTRAKMGATATSEYNISGRRLDADGELIVVSAAPVDTNYHIRVADFKYATSPTPLPTAQLWHYLDGTLDGFPIEWQPVTGLTSNTNSVTFRVGGSSSGAGVEFLDGQIAEVIVVHNAPSIKTRQAIEGYLAWKWGLRSRLPVSHPYKYSAPAETIDDGINVLTVTVVAYAVTQPNVVLTDIPYVTVDVQTVVVEPMSNVAFKLNGAITLPISVASIAVDEYVVGLSKVYVLWTPAHIQTDAWWDFSDAANYLLVSSSYARINDQSGNGRNLEQSLHSARPTQNVEGWNGLNTGQFTTAQFLEFMNFDQVSGQQIFLALDTTNLGTGERIFLQRSGAGVGLYLGRLSNDRKPYVNWGGVRASAAATEFGTRILRWGFTMTSTVVQVDGKTPVTASHSGQTLSQWTTFSNATTQQAAFEAFECLIIPAASATAANIDRINGYLAWKWGMKSRLPLGHPYKNLPPYVPAAFTINVLSVSVAAQSSVGLTLRIPVPAQTYAVTPRTVGLMYVPLGQTLFSVSSVAVNVTQPNAGLFRQRRMEATEDYIETYFEYVEFINYPQRLFIDPRSFTVGTPASPLLRHRHIMGVSAQAYTVANGAVTLSRGLPVTVTSLVVACPSVAVLYNQAVLVDVLPVAVAAQPVVVIAEHRITGVAFVDTNTKIVTLRQPVDGELIVSSRAFAATFQNFEILRHRVLDVAVAAYSVATPDVPIRRVYTLVCTVQSYAVASENVALTQNQPIVVAPAAVAATAVVVDFALYRKVVVDAAAYVCDTPAVETNKVQQLQITPVAYDATFEEVGTLSNRRVVVTSRTVVIHCGSVWLNRFSTTQNAPLLPDAGFEVALTPDVAWSLL